MKETTNQFSRPPVIVILGHVDHGKTTLLDTIRKADVASHEYGGITQSIGAYQITIDNKKLTFIDTPGHEAFTKMRSQGAQVADIAILIVAANDSVMPQTAESIKIIQDANIPYVVAINKIDLPEANFDKTIQDLLRHNVLLENYGGQVPFVKISAKAGTGVPELLDLISLIAEMSEIKGDPKAEISATIIESKLDKNRGPLATAIVKNGTLHVGDKIFIGTKENKIRALIDFQGKNIPEAGPGTPVEILGLSVVPPVGSNITQNAQTIESTVSTQNRQGGKNSSSQATESLNLILKTDTLGSLEAVIPLIPANVNLIESATGEITEADVLLAKSTKAIVLGFNTRVSSAATKLAETEKVLVRTYKIIYELLDELSDAASGMLEPEIREEILGTGTIVAEFPYEKMKVAGTKVNDGRLARGDLVHVGPNNLESKIKSLRVGRDEVNKVEKGKECGVLLDPQVDFRPGDAIISYRND